MFRILACVIFGISCTASAAPTASDNLECVVKLNPSPDPKWKELYDEIEGSSLQEKQQNALTTWEMKAVSEMSLQNAENKLVATFRTLYAKSDDHGKSLLLDAHLAWNNYVQLQARLLAADCKGGSAESLYARAVLEHEIKRQTRIYQALADGHSIAVDPGCLLAE